MTDNPGLSEQRALIERIDAELSGAPGSPDNRRSMLAEARRLLAQPPASGGDERLRAALRLWRCDSCAGRGTVRGGLWDNDPRVPRETCFACGGSGIHKTAQKALTNSGAPVPGDGGLRAALEEIELLATNHGGWFEQDPFGEYAKLGNIASEALTNSRAPVPGDGDLRESAAAVWREAYIAVYGCEPTHSKEAYQAAYDVIAAALAHAAPAPPDVPEAIMRHCLQEAANNTGSPAAMLAAAPKQATPTDVEGGGGNPRKRS